MPAWIVVHGWPADPSLPPPAYDPSTYSVSASTGMSPHVPPTHGATTRHVVSPGTAMSPFPQGSSGSVAVQPMLPSGANPAAHSSGGIPAGRQPPPSMYIS